MIPEVTRIIGVVLGVLAFGFETDVLVRHVIRRKQDFNQPACHVHGIIRRHPKQPPPRVVIVDEPRCKEQRKGGDHDLKNLVPVTALVAVDFWRHDAPVFVLANEDHEPERHHPEFPNGNPLIVDNPHALLSVRL